MITNNNLAIGTSESMLLVPFRMKTNSSKEFNKYLGSNSGKWEKEDPGQYYYLGRHINAIINNKSDNICTFYKLTKEARANIGLPNDTEVIHFTSTIIEKGDKEEYDFYLKNIRVAYFTSYIGFLILDIAHIENESMQQIADKCFSLSRFLNDEHDSGIKNSKLLFSYKTEEEHIFSLKNIVLELLHVNEFKNQENLILFPSTKSRRCIVYHRILLKEKDCNYERNLYYLRRVLHSSFLWENQDNRANRSDFTYSPTENIYWSGCQNGVVSLSFAEEGNNNEIFLTKQFPNNVRRDYFFLYLILLHEREALFWYNAEAVSLWKNHRKLVAMRKNLVEFRICFAYNTVSEEMAYQNLYQNIYDCLNLTNLELDIQDVITQVDIYQQDQIDRRSNKILSLIAFLAVFSTINDLLDLVGKMRAINISTPQLIITGILITLIITAFILFIYKKR